MTLSKQISFDGLSSSTTLTPVELQPFQTTSLSGYVVAFTKKEFFGKLDLLNNSINYR